MDDPDSDQMPTNVGNVGYGGRSVSFRVRRPQAPPTAPNTQPDRRFAMNPNNAEPICNADHNPEVDANQDVLELSLYELFYVGGGAVNAFLKIDC
jgi:hypothetical protein